MTTAVQRGRWTADIEGDFVVFLIGMRVHRLRAVSRWLPTFRAMPRMLRELEADEHSGLLGHWNYFGLRSVMLVQYWRSLEHLQRYAHDADREHRPAWLRFFRESYRNASVGIWHETYLVTAGSYECIYANMPAFGLGRAAELVPVSKLGEQAAERITPQERPS